MVLLRSSMIKSLRQFVSMVLLSHSTFIDCFIVCKIFTIILLLLFINKFKETKTTNRNIVVFSSISLYIIIFGISCGHSSSVQPCNLVVTLP